MLRQMWENTLRQTLHVRVASDTQNNSVFSLEDIVHEDITYFPPFIIPNVISSGLTIG